MTTATSIISLESSDDDDGGDQTRLAPHNPAVPAEMLLAMAAASLDGIEKERLAAENRLRAAKDNGLGDAPGTRALQAQLDVLITLNDMATKDLQRELRRHPLGPWIKRQIGIGEKQGGRLIAAIGDPYWNYAEDRRRRGPAELWAYCGYAPGQRRKKGVKSNWNANAKMRAYLVATSCIKQMHSPYRAVYDEARARWADKDTSDLHKHNHALHCTAKAILKGLFNESRDLHGDAPDDMTAGTQATSAQRVRNGDPDHQVGGAQTQPVQIAVP